MTGIELLSFSMRKEAPAPGADWCKIVNKKGEPAQVYIYDEIGFWGTNAKDFANELRDIDASEIELYINSPGGSVVDVLAIGAALRSHKATVKGYVTGMAASAASFILQYCDERYITRNGMVMIHDAKAYAGGNAKQMRTAADLLDKISNDIADIYAVRSGQGTVESWRETMVSGDTWYDGNESVDAGLVDSVVDNPDEEQEESTENSWTQEEVEAFLVLPAAQLAKDASRSIITNRVEEAHMTGNAPQNQQTPPAAPQPPAPAAPAAPAPAASSEPHKFVVNGVEVTDFAAVQTHISGLESFKKETIEAGRKSFVKQLADEGRILASDENLEATENFALSLSSEQFANWKASMSAAPKQAMFQQHGVTPGDQQAPSNGGTQSDIDREIASLEEIVQAHRDSGMSEDVLKTKASYTKLQELKTQKASAS